MKTIKTTILWSLGIVTVCILSLTLLNGVFLYKSINSDNGNNTNNTECYYHHNTMTNNKAKVNKPKPANIETAEGEHSDDGQYSSFLDSLVYNVTLAVNSVNNVLTSGSIFIGILTLFLALVGVIGFYTLKEKIDTQFSHFSQVISKAEELENNVDDLYKSLIANYRFTRKSNDTLYDVIDAIAESVDDKEIISQQLHDHHITNLYCPIIDLDKKSDVKEIKDKALNYLQDNATKKDIPDLEYISKNDKDPEIQFRATKLIAKLEIESNTNNNSCGFSRIINWLKYLITKKKK